MAGIEEESGGPCDQWGCAYCGPRKTNRWVDEAILGARWAGFYDRDWLVSTIPETVNSADRCSDARKHGFAAVIPQEDGPDLLVSMWARESWRAHVFEDVYGPLEAELAALVRNRPVFSTAYLVGEQRHLTRGKQWELAIAQAKAAGMTNRSAAVVLAAGREARAAEESGLAPVVVQGHTPKGATPDSGLDREPRELAADEGVRLTTGELGQLAERYRTVLRRWSNGRPRAWAYPTDPHELAEYLQLRGALTVCPTRQAKAARWPVLDEFSKERKAA